MGSYLVTGAAGFIGSHVVEALRRDRHRVVGVDDLNPYYDVARKKANLDEIGRDEFEGSFEFHRGDVRDPTLVARLFDEHDFDAVVHLAAMAGVRNSILHPDVYYSVNVDGTRNLLETSVRKSDLARFNFVFASTSSVYGATTRIPFVESDPCERPLVPYSASKRAAEIIGHTYHHLYGLNFTGVRFFTVYGPRGRPDMMAFKLLDSISSGNVVPLNNGGEMYRDWTYVSDIVAGVVAAARTPLGYELVNLGRGESVLLRDFVTLIEETVGRPAALEDAAIPPGDIPATHADISKAHRLLGYEPVVSVKAGVEAFVRWYRDAVGDQAETRHRPKG